jgi:hypothetical protein
MEAGNARGAWITGAGMVARPSHKPLIALSIVSVARMERSTVENSTPVRSEVMMRLFIRDET